MTAHNPPVYFRMPNGQIARCDASSPNGCSEWHDAKNECTIDGSSLSALRTPDPREDLRIIWADDHPRWGVLSAEEKKQNEMAMKLARERFEGEPSS